MSKLRFTNDLTSEFLRSRVDYNAGTGRFFAAIGPSFGREVGCLTSRGYIKIVVGGKCYLAHRLAWLYVHGEWPPVLIDHINGVTTDNRIENLRPATSRENNMNTKASRAASLQRLEQCGSAVVDSYNLIGRSE